MSWKLRPVRREDIPELHILLKETHTGLTNIPENIQELELFVHNSINSFKTGADGTETNTFVNRQYVFVLEDCKEEVILGVSAIQASTGGLSPLYFFRKERIESTSHRSEAIQLIPILQPISYVRGPSEIASLFLSQQARGRGLGRLLSLGRFLFIANAPLRFTGSIQAELRGVIRDDGSSPFWDGIGAHFIHMSFSEAMYCLKNEGRSFISNILPRFPIYIDLLPTDVRDVIGKTHVQTQAALSLLLGEGFHPSDEVDVFDGGPKLTADIHSIRTIKYSRIGTVATDTIQNEGKTYLISNCTGEFSATMSTLSLSPKGEVMLPNESIEILGLLPGSLVRYVPLTGNL